MFSAHDVAYGLLALGSHALFQLKLRDLVLVVLVARLQLEAEALDGLQQAPRGELLGVVAAAYPRHLRE